MGKILNEKQVAWAYEMWCLGYTQKQIGDALHVHWRTITNYFMGKQKIRPVLVAPPEISGLGVGIGNMQRKPQIISVEGYKAFIGTMLVKPQYIAPDKVTGQWLYKPGADCWYCGGKSYPAKICEVLEVV